MGRTASECTPLIVHSLADLKAKFEGRGLCQAVYTRWLFSLAETIV